MVSLRNLGVKHTTWRILEETILKRLFLFRNFVIYDKDLTKLNRVRLQNPKVQYSFVSEDEPDILGEIEEISGFPRDQIVERLRTGSDCLVAIDGDKVVGFNLVSFGNIYITGETYSTDFHMQDPYQASLAGSMDVFITKLNATGNALTYSTYLGGSGYDAPSRIRVDGSGTTHTASRPKSWGTLSAPPKKAASNSALVLTTLPVGPAERRSP